MQLLWVVGFYFRTGPYGCGVSFEFVSVVFLVCEMNTSDSKVKSGVRWCVFPAIPSRPGGARGVVSDSVPEVQRVGDGLADVTQPVSSTVGGTPQMVFKVGGRSGNVGRLWLDEEKGGAW